ncbi:hypothetical protein CFELI_12745 [Corynebacterium felinum]|nr:hypothetical protein CFELI_12745 [Corynebacterium felinum]
MRYFARMSSDTCDLYRHLYATSMRGEAEVRRMAGMNVHQCGPVWVAYSKERGWGFVSYSPEQALKINESDIQAVIEFLAGVGDIDSFEWKTWASDPALPLAELGFVRGEEEVVMMGDIDVLADYPIPAGVEVRQVLTEEELVAASHTRSAVFGLNAKRTRQFIDRNVGDIEGAGLFAAWADGAVVGTGRMEKSAADGVVGLFSGAVVEKYRGRGIYRALLAARAHKACSWGMQFAYSECSPYSAPILQRAGFVPIEHTTPAELRL